MWTTLLTFSIGAAVAIAAMLLVSHIRSRKRCVAFQEIANLFRSQLLDWALDANQRRDAKVFHISTDSEQQAPPNFEKMGEEEKRHCRDLLVRRFQILARFCPQLADVPAEADLSAFWKQYEAATKEVAKTTLFGRMRVGLVGIFLLVELLGIKLGLPFSGFARREIRKLPSFDAPLLELACKCDEKIPKEWSSELSLPLRLFWDMACYTLADTLANSQLREG